MAPDSRIDVSLRLRNAKRFQRDAEGSARSVERLGKAGDKAGRGARGIERYAKAGRKWQNIGGGLTRTVTAPLALGFGLAAKSAMGFEKQMSSLGAVSGASGKQLDSLRESAMKAGADTMFSAKDAAVAQTELAKGGLSVKNIMGGGLNSALALAAAGELELGEAAGYTANAMNLFKLRGGESMRVADAMAMAANATTAEVGDFGMALTQAGSVAKTVGLSFNETMLGLTALAGSGIKGSDAGTSLKSALIQLVKPSAKQSALASDLGLKFTDAQGRMKSMADISGMLRNRLGGMTKAQRTATLATLAGTDGVRTLTSLYDAGPKKLGEWAKGLGKSGTAAEVARKKYENLGGDWEQLTGSLETLGIATGTILIPALAKGAKALTKLTNAFSGLPKGAQTGVLAVGGVAAVMGPAMWAVGGLMRSLGRMKKILGGMKGVFARVFGGAGVAGGTAASTSVAATTAAQTPKKLARRSAVFATAGAATGTTMGTATGTAAAASTAGIITASSKRGKLRSSFLGAARLIGPAFAIAFAAPLISDLDKKIQNWARRKGATSLYKSRNAADNAGDLTPDDPLGLGKLYGKVFGEAKGGLIGMAGGGSVMRSLVPPGEDTVRGLQFGEFVVRRKAVETHGVDAMERINRGLSPSPVQVALPGGPGGGPVPVIHNHFHVDGKEVHHSVVGREAAKQGRR